MSSKPTLDISVEELLKTLEKGDNAKKPPPTETNDPVFDFLAAYNILPGKHKIAEQLLFKLFKQFNKIYNKNRRQFNIDVGNYLPHAYSGIKKFYLINQDYLQIGETLLKIVSGKKIKVNTSKAHINQFEAFMDQNSLHPDNLFVEGDILYYVYNNWCDKNKRRHMAYTKFLQLCEMYYEKKRMSNNNIYWFGVNENIKLLITKEQVLNWREGRAKKYGNDKPDKIAANKVQEVLYGEDTNNKEKTR